MDSYIGSSLSFGTSNYSPLSSYQDFFSNQIPIQQPTLGVRIIDGLYVGNAAASQDEDFCYTNKVTLIINCASAEVAVNTQLQQRMRVDHMTFAWRDLPVTEILDRKDIVITKICRAIDKVFQEGESVLIHSVTGTNRCCVIAAAYLIQRYGWSYENTMLYMEAMFPEMNIQPYFKKQLKNFAKRKQAEMDIFSLKDSSVILPLHKEQVLIRNTVLDGHYLNSLTSSQHNIQKENKETKKYNQNQKRKQVNFSEKFGFAPLQLNRKNLRPINFEQNPTKSILKTPNKNNRQNQSTNFATSSHTTTKQNGHVTFTESKTTFSEPESSKSDYYTSSPQDTTVQRPTPIQYNIPPQLSMNGWGFRTPIVQKEKYSPYPPSPKNESSHEEPIRLFQKRNVPKPPKITTTGISDIANGINQIHIRDETPPRDRDENNLFRESPKPKFLSKRFTFGPSSPTQTTTTFKSDIQNSNYMDDRMDNYRSSHDHSVGTKMILTPKPPPISPVKSNDEEEEDEVDYKPKKEQSEKPKKKKKKKPVPPPPPSIGNGYLYTGRLSQAFLTQSLRPPPRRPATSTSSRDSLYKKPSKYSTQPISYFDEPPRPNIVIYTSDSDLAQNQKLKKARPKSAPASTVFVRKKPVPPKKKRPLSAGTKKTTISSLSSIYKELITTNGVKKKKKKRKLKKEERKLVESRLMRPTLSFLRKTVKRPI